MPLTPAPRQQRREDQEFQVSLPGRWSLNPWEIKGQVFWEPCLGEHTFLPWESRTKQPDKWIRNPGQPLCSWSHFLHFRGLWRLTVPQRTKWGSPSPTQSESEKLSGDLAACSAPACP